MAFCKTAAGNPENQDRGAVIPCENSTVLVVADGVGGRSGAAEAATLAVEFVRRNAERFWDAKACAKLLQEMDHAIARDPDAGETTCTIAVLQHEGIFGVSAGDSAAWLIDKNGQGFAELTIGQTRKPFVGLGGVHPFPFSCRRKKGERLLLATDGLLKYASSERIVEICREDSTESAAEHLIELVRYPSGDLPDDVTVILADL